MKALALVIWIVFLTGCSTSTAQYYEAVQKTAEANSKAAQAKFDALSAIASAGDGQAASAAVMALALTNTQSVQPVPQRSDALQWASVLAAPISSLGMMWMQADSAKTMARYNSQVDMARISAESADSQALYGAFVNSHQVTGDALGNIDYTPFVNGMVTLGNAGISSNVDIATKGLDVANNLGTSGMSNLTNLGVNGMTLLGQLGEDGLNALVESNSDWLNYSVTRYITFAGMMATEQSGCIATANSEGQIVVTCN